MRLKVKLDLQHVNAAKHKTSENLSLAEQLIFDGHLFVQNPKQTEGFKKRRFSDNFRQNRS